MTPTPDALCPPASAARDASTYAAVDRIVTFFEQLTPASVAELPQLYDAQARFKDPFNDVTGLPAISHIFTHMFVQLENPRFVVTQRVVQEQQVFLTWAFHFCFRRFKRGRPQVILGGTHLVLSAQGLITLHRDYWDAAEELYEKLPLLGGLMRWLKRQAKP